MGAVAGPNIIVLMLTAMEHDIQARMNAKMDSQMLLSMRSIFYGDQKARLYSQLQNQDPNSYAYKKVLEQISRFEAQERVIQQMEKQIEMQMKQLETQLKMVQQRKEGAEKMLEKNIQTAFNYGQR